MSSKTHWRDIPVFQIGNRQDTSAWQVDPRQGLLLRHKVGLVMVPPVGLDKFMAAESFLETTTQFVHGAKGSGKTSLLLAKRLLLEEAIEERKLLCVPSEFPYVFSPFFDDTTISFDTWESLGFADREAWKYLWLVLLGAYILGAVDRDAEKVNAGSERTPLLSERLLRFIGGTRIGARLDEKQWLQSLKAMVEGTKGNPMESLKKLYDAEVLPHLNGAITERKKPIFVFVDGIDETFRGPGGSPLMKLVKEKKLRRLLRKAPGDQADADVDPYVLARKLWVSAQVSLLSVSTEFLKQSGGHVRLIGSMRSEAYLESTRDGAQAHGQRANLIQAIQYTPDHLEAIVRANIRADLRMQNYDRPSREDEFARFFGSAEIHNSQVQISEPYFQYLCRHSFAEPRDLMLMGQNLSKVPPEARRDDSRVHQIVVSATETILTDYFHFMDEEWDKRFEQAVLQHIRRNILTIEDARHVAREVTTEKKIAEKHPLCYLYKRGLIGVIDGSMNQAFHRIASVNGSERSKLPASSVYLVHPVLDHLISLARQRAGKERYIITQGIAVGHGLPWIPGMRLKRVRLAMEGTAVQLTIDGQNLSDSSLSAHAFRWTYDIPTGLLIACLEEMVAIQSNVVPIASVLARVEGMAAKGLLPRSIRRGGLNQDTTSYCRDTLHAPDRQPPPFETINNRLQEYNLTGVAMTRSLKFQTIALSGIEGRDIEISISSARGTAAT